MTLPAVCTSQLNRWSFGDTDFGTFGGIVRDTNTGGNPARNGHYDVPPGYSVVEQAPPAPFPNRADGVSVDQDVSDSFLPFPSSGAAYSFWRDSCFTCDVDYSDFGLGPWYNTNHWTFSIWAKWSGEGILGIQGLCGDGEHGNGSRTPPYLAGWYIRGDGGGSSPFVLTFQCGNATGTVISIILDDDLRDRVEQWFNYAITSDGTTIKAYRNGVLVGSAAGVVNTAQRLRFGCIDGRLVFSGAMWPWIGEWDEATMWDTALTASEILTAYRSCGELAVFRSRFPLEDPAASPAAPAMAGSSTTMAFSPTNGFKAE